MSEGGAQGHCGVYEGGDQGHCGVSEGGAQCHCGVSEGVAQGHCGVSEGDVQGHCDVSEGGAQGHCDVSEGGYQGHCLVEIRNFKYDADLLILFITFLFCFVYDFFNISGYYKHDVFLREVKLLFYDFCIVWL